MRFAYFGLGVLMLLGCRRHPLAESDRGDSGLPVVDAPVVDTGVEPSTDLAVSTDGPGPVDVAGPIDASFAKDGPPPACSELRALAAAGPLTPRHARNALFSRDRRLLIVQAVGGPPDDPLLVPGPPDDLLLVPLPEGVPQTLLSGVRDVEWLGTSGKVLATLYNGGLVVVSLDGTPNRTIASGTCAHLAVPDGSRVFVVRDCGGSIPTTGALDEIDVATGAATPRAPAATVELAVSPSGRFAAYVVALDSGGRGTGVLHVLDGDQDQPLAETPALAPTFVSDQRLLFMINGPNYDSNDAYVHVPGSSGASLRIAQGRNFGFKGYRISPDGALVLAASWPSTHPPWDTSLFAIPLDGGGERQLATDLLPYYVFQLAINPYAFSADGRSIVFMPGPNPSPAGVFAIPPTGGERRRLGQQGGTAFAVSPYADRVAIIDGATTGQGQVTSIFAAASGAVAFSFDTAGAAGGFSFVPGDRGLLYIDRTTPIRLSHVSFVDGRRTQLGSWTRGHLPIGDYPQGEMRAGYPLDPTGCFTIVDSDLPESTGTRLVVLPDAPE